MAVGYLATAVLVFMFVMALFGDIFVWAIWGTKFVLSPRFHQAETWLNGFISVSFLSFMGIDKGLQHLQQRKWKLFLVAFLTFFVAAMPFAKPCALFVRLATVKGVAALFHPIHILLIAFLILVFFCKCKIVFSLWRLLRPSQPRETRRIVVSE